MEDDVNRQGLKRSGLHQDSRDLKKSLSESPLSFEFSDSPLRPTFSDKTPYPASPTFASVEQRLLQLQLASKDDTRIGLKNLPELRKVVDTAHEAQNDIHDAVSQWQLALVEGYRPMDIHLLPGIVGISRKSKPGSGLLSLQTLSEAVADAFIVERPGHYDSEAYYTKIVKWIWDVRQSFSQKETDLGVLQYLLGISFCCDGCVSRVSDPTSQWLHSEVRRQRESLQKLQKEKEEKQTIIDVLQVDIRGMGESIDGLMTEQERLKQIVTKQQQEIERLSRHLRNADFELERLRKK